MIARKIYWRRKELIMRPPSFNFACDNGRVLVDIRANLFAAGCKQVVVSRCLNKGTPYPNMFIIVFCCLANISKISKHSFVSRINRF